jgi:thiol-disulfide isomerase/thioredoxin
MNDESGKGADESSSRTAGKNTGRDAGGTSPEKTGAQAGKPRHHSAKGIIATLAVAAVAGAGGIMYSLERHGGIDGDYKRGENLPQDRATLLATAKPTVAAGSATPGSAGPGEDGKPADKAAEGPTGQQAPKRAIKLFTSYFDDLDGKAQSMGKYQRKTLVVNFWATWCAPCVEEMPELDELQAGFKGRDARETQVIGIGVDSAENIGKFAGKHKIDYPLFVAGVQGSELARALGNKGGGLPFTVIIDAEGNIKKTYLGRLNMENLRRDLSSM